MNARQRPARRDEGFTLVELVVSMAVFSVIMVVVIAALIASMQNAHDTVARVDAIDNARMAVAQIDSKVRSGSLIEDPAHETYANAGVAPGYSVRVLTDRGGVSTCAQWRVVFDGDDVGTLQYREWPSYRADLSTEWAQVATGLVRPRTPAVAGDATTYLPFALVESTGTASLQSLRVALRVDPETHADSDPELVTVTVTGRNTIFGRAGLECGDVPDA